MDQMMDFFEELKERANAKGLEWLEAVDASLTNRDFAARMRDLTIEALNEMMVGQPIRWRGDAFIADVNGMIHLLCEGDEEAIVLVCTNPAGAKRK